MNIGLENFPIFSRTRKFAYPDLFLVLAIFIRFSYTDAIASDPFSQSTDGSPCNSVISPGDCDPDACGFAGMTCEARYIRFWDPVGQVDRSRKSCQCVEEPICSVVGMHAFSGCKSYADLSTAGQRMIREWSMSRAERRSFYKNHIFQKYINGTNSTKRRFLSTKLDPFIVYSDRSRHHQLILANSRFCCKTSRKIRRFVAEAYVSTANCYATKFSVIALCFLFLIPLLH